MTDGTQLALSMEWKQKEEITNESANRGIHKKS